MKRFSIRSGPSTASLIASAASFKDALEDIAASPTLETAKVVVGA